MFSTFLKSLNVSGLSVPLFFITSSLLAFLLVICAAQESFCIPFLLPLLPVFVSCLPTSLPSCSCSHSCSAFLTYIKIEKCLWVIVRGLGVVFFFFVFMKLDIASIYTDSELYNSIQEFLGCIKQDLNRNKQTILISWDIALFLYLGSSIFHNLTVISFFNSNEKLKTRIIFIIHCSLGSYIFWSIFSAVTCISM